MGKLSKYGCIIIAVLMFLFAKPYPASGQMIPGSEGGLFSAGYASAFIGGLYDAFYPYAKLKQHGDFGLGAPAGLDGELIMLHGKIFKTRYTGETLPVNDTGKTPYALVCFFKPVVIYHLAKPMNKAALFHYLDSVLSEKNAIYAIHIKRSFKLIKTRAFPPVDHKPYPPLASMLNLQHFFEYTYVSGDLVGYRIPAFLEGQLISGYHFHFLDNSAQKGGHLIDVVVQKVEIEAEILKKYTVELPQTNDFYNSDLKIDRNDDIKHVENGKKQ